jgi:hypothetical protein
MVEAARTTASTGATWAIVIVAVSVLAFWLAAIYLADRSQVRASGRARAATWPAYAGPWARGGMAGEQAAQIPEQAVREPGEARGGHAADEPAQEAEPPTRADIPAQSARGSAQPGPAAGRPAMPTQRTGDADRAERSRAGQGGPEEENPGR